MSTDFVKQTLRENLSRVIIPHVADGLWSIYDNAKTACERNKQPDQTIKTFQNLLTRIPDWKDDVLTAEVERISKASKCDYIDDLLLGVFVSYIRAFASLQQVEEHVEIPFDRPTLALFVHTLYKAAARSAWSNAYLFKTIGVTSEQQARNRRDIETMLGGSLNEVIDSFIPWKDISNAYFRARTTAPTPAPAPVVTEDPKVKFENIPDEDDDDEEEDRPRLELGADAELEFTDDEDDIEKKATGEVVLNM